MSITDQQTEIVEAFRTFIEDGCAHDDRYGAAERNDREDGSTLATRFAAGESCWFEVAVRPMLPQLRVGFVTDDRWKSEEVEQAIQDSGDTMEEFVGIAFDEAGLDWEEPPVEHYRDGGTHFYFATPIELEHLGDLDEEKVRNKTLRMLEGYLIAFGPMIVGDEE